MLNIVKRTNFKMDQPIHFVKNSQLQYYTEKYAHDLSTDVVQYQGRELIAEGKSEATPSKEGYESIQKLN